MRQYLHGDRGGRCVKTYLRFKGSGWRWSSGSDSPRLPNSIELDDVELHFD
jgi:hypothetical protein